MSSAGCSTYPAARPTEPDHAARPTQTRKNSDRLLSAQFSFVLTQSFTFLTKAASQALLQRRHDGTQCGVLALAQLDRDTSNN